MTLRHDGVAVPGRICKLWTSPLYPAVLKAPPPGVGLITAICNVPAELVSIAGTVKET